MCRFLDQQLRPGFKVHLGSTPAKNDNKHDKATVGVKKDGIDMTFKNLSLDVKVKDNKTIRVVNEVTGRLGSGTMTALMGGSGAGNLHGPWLVI